MARAPGARVGCGRAGREAARAGPHPCRTPSALCTPPRPLRAPFTRPAAPAPAPPAHPSAVPSLQPRPLCLRAQHVFPLSMLRLHEHEWHQMVDDVWVGLSKQHGEGIAMDADN